MKKPKFAWHRHIFSPRCIDEIHGRFDVLDDDRGPRVFNVGTRRIAAYARTREEAIEIAEALAAEWRLDPRLIRVRIVVGKDSRTTYVRTVKQAMRLVVNLFPALREK